MKLCLYGLNAPEVIVRASGCRRWIDMSVEMENESESANSDDKKIYRKKAV